MKPIITGAYETRYQRHPDESVTTHGLIADAVMGALRDAGLSLSDVDGLGVSSFSLAPDHVIDVAVKMGMSLRWISQDPLGGASGINLLQHAARAVECGDASVVVLVAGDHLDRQAFHSLNANYNVATRDHLAPLQMGGPNALFAMITASQMRQTGLEAVDYAQIAIAQRRWAGTNPLAVYRSPLTVEQYLEARVVSPPLRIYDCVPVVSGADALVIQAQRPGSAAEGVEVIAVAARHNADLHEGDGLKTGLVHVTDDFWDAAGMGPEDVNVLGVYDDYPVMVVEQLRDLGFVAQDDLARFLHEEIGTGRRAVNTSGGQLSAGQAGSAGGMHFLVEAVNQLRHRRGAGQVADAQTAVVSGYGMVQYRYGVCANVVALGRTS